MVQLGEEDGRRLVEIVTVEHDQLQTWAAAQLELRRSFELSNKFWQ